MGADRQSWAALADEAHQRAWLAAERSAQAGERAKEIEEARRSAGGPGGPIAVSSAGSARRAAEQAAASRERAAAAHRSAAVVHDLAGRAHDAAAEFDPAHAAEHREAARRHRADADRARRQEAAER